MEEIKDMGLEIKIKFDFFFFLEIKKRAAEKAPGDNAFLARRREETGGRLGSAVRSSTTSCGRGRPQRPRSLGV